MSLFYAAPKTLASSFLCHFMATLSLSPPANRCGRELSSGTRAEIRGDGDDACVMGSIVDWITHPSMSPPSRFPIATSKRVPPSRAACHRRAGRKEDVGKCAVPNIDEDQLQQMVLVDEGQSAGVGAVACYQAGGARCD
jgi:hypothetical protein